MNIKSVIHGLLNRSPVENLKIVQTRFALARLVSSPESRNDMLDPLLSLKTFPIIAEWCLSKLPEADILLLGDAGIIDSWQIEKNLIGKSIRIQNWNWTDSLNPGNSGRIVICCPPYSVEHWNIIWKANSENLRVTTLGELIAPFLQISVLMKSFDYYLNSMDEVVPFLLGKKFFGPLKELDSIFPLAGKRLIEFGCFDGYQSLGLCHLGAKLTCMDARADNVIKTRAALNTVGFNAHIIMDDFHNAHANKYGRFDLAFAHGVYYHSVAPFVFLENLMSLSNSIFLGGFCATEELPSTKWHNLEYQGRSYRAKHYLEIENFTAGLNKHAWFFHKDDLKGFFTERGFEVTIISDTPSTITAGNFTRFLACKLVH